MPSRILILALTLFLSGCSLRFNDKVEKTPMNVNLGGGCLTNSGKVLAKFADGSASESELDGFWNCAEKSFNTFKTHAEGDPTSKDVYKATDLSRFMTKYFLKGKEISPAFLSEAMAIKQSFVGGGNDQLTRKELANILSLLKVGRRVTQRLRPHMPIRYDSFIERNYSKEQFETAITEFQESLAEFGTALNETQGSYSIDHFAGLIEELGKFLYPDQENEGAWVNTVLRMTVAMRPAKAIFISPDKDEISQSDWATIYQMGPKYYSLYLRMRFYSHGENNYLFGDGLFQLERLFDDSIRLLSQVLAKKEGNEIKSTEIEELLLAMEKSDMLPVKIDTARASVKLIFGKLFKGDTSETDYTIRHENFAQLSRTFHFATEGLRALEFIYRYKFGEQNYDNSGLRTEDIAAFSTEKLLEVTFLHDQVSKAAVESLVKSAGEISTIFPGKSLHVMIPNGKTKPKLSLQHMAKMHLLRSANRLLISAYAGAKADGLSEKQVNILLSDILPIMRDPALALADADTQATFSKRLFEASLFLPSSDGDKGLTMNEAIEFESLLLSTIFYASNVHAKIAELCAVPLAAAKAQKIPAPCLRKNWLKSASSIWSSIPGTAAYFTQLPDREQEALFGRLENFLRKGRTSDYFTLGDTRSFILLPYYVELLFARFDSNHDGLLENKEAEDAYPVFHPFLAEKAAQKGKTDPADHHAIYMYLLANRTLPSADNWSDAIAYAWHRYIAGDKAFKADRGQVVEIFEKLLTL